MKKIKEKKSQKHTNQGDRNTLLGREAKRQRSTKPDWQKETEKQTERQTDRQAGRQAGMQTDRQTDKQTDRQSYLSFKNLLKRYLPSRTFACFPFKICSWETLSYYVSQRSLSVLNLSIKIKSTLGRFYRILKEVPIENCTLYIGFLMRQKM